MKNITLAKPTIIATYILAAVLVLVPFHAFLTITLAGLTGNYDLLRLWKEIILLLLSPLAAVLLWKTPEVWQRSRGNWLFWCMAAYVLLHIGLGLAALAKGQVNYYAMVYAWIVNLRFLLIFMIALVLAVRLSKIYGARGSWLHGDGLYNNWLHGNWHKLLLWPAAVVVGFGLLQLFALPLDFLQRFGYGADTITPFETVDEKLDYIRIQSTLRGANPLGAYMVLVLAGLTVLLLRNVKDKVSDSQHVTGVTLFSAALIVLLATYSRSAYIGVLIAVLTAVWLVLHGRQARRRLAIGLVSFVVIAAGATMVLRDNDRFENTFFHTDENSSSPMSSNAGRASALQSGVSDVLSEPFGRGPGTAGPASQHNLQPARIAENYYLQIGQEVGWAGLGLFVAINILVARELWRRRQDTLARMLLASLAGIAFVNLLQHAWTDDTLALIWWGLAGIALATTPAILAVTKTDAAPAEVLIKQDEEHGYKKENSRHKKKPGKTRSGQAEAV